MSAPNPPRHVPKAESIWVGTAVLAGARLVGRFAGFLASAVIANSYGAGAIADAFFVAQLIPIAFMEWTGNILKVGFIPTHADIRERDGADHAERIASQFSSWVVLISGLLAGLVFIFASELISVQAGGLDASTHALAVRMVRVLAIAVLLGGVFAITETRLNAAHHFSATARGRLVGKVWVVVVLVVTAGRGDPVWLAAAFLTGAFVQVAAMGREGFGVWRGGWAKLLPFVPGTKHVLALLLPAMVWMMLDQFKFLVDQNFASRLDSGQLAALSYASRIVNTVVAITAGSFLTAVFPRLADLMAAAGDVADEATRAGKRVLTFSMLGAALAVGGASLLVQVSFERGAFTAADTHATAGALVAYGPSILFISFNMLLKILLFLRRRAGLIVGVGLVELLLNGWLDWLWVDGYGIRGLAAASSVTTLVVLVGVGPVLARERLFRPRELASVAVRLLPGAVAAALCMAGVSKVAEGQTWWVAVAWAGVGAVAGFLVFSSFAHLAKVHRFPWGRRG